MDLAVVHLGQPAQLGSDLRGDGGREHVRGRSRAAAASKNILYVAYTMVFDIFIVSIRVFDTPFSVNKDV